MKIEVIMNNKKNYNFDKASTVDLISLYIILENFNIVTEHEDFSSSGRYR